MAFENNMIENKTSGFFLKIISVSGNQLVNSNKQDMAFQNTIVKLLLIFSGNNINFSDPSLKINKAGYGSVFKNTSKLNMFNKSVTFFPFSRHPCASEHGDHFLAGQGREPRGCGYIAPSVVWPPETGLRGKLSLEVWL